MRARTLLLLAGLVVLLAAVFWAAGPSLGRVAIRWLDVSEKPRRSRYVLVLPGDENGRPFLAAALVQRGLAETVLIPTHPCPDAGGPAAARPAHRLIYLVLRHEGVAVGQIRFLSAAGPGTIGEMRALARLLASQPDARVMVVTNGYHTRRCRWALRHASPEVCQRATFVAAITDAFPPNAWWESDDGFTAVVGEYAKLIYYAVRYETSTFCTLVGLLIVAAIVVCRPRLLNTGRRFLRQRCHGSDRRGLRAPS